MTASSRFTNALVRETSPYLLQHAHNPVAWQPWGEEALEKARRENKPILLSIGYSACHWCHVMAHESFEDEATAQVMNELFVNIKVDREERPDLDRIYQTAHQMLAQRPGGWPLTMFLSPGDHTPFFGGTYFPKEPRFGLPAFTDLCRRVEAYFREHRDEIEAQNASVRETFKRLAAGAPTAGTQITESALDRARAEIAGQYEPEYGGFGQAPKFPHPTTIERLLRHWAAHPDDHAALHMARFSLHAMAAGGIYDQLGGGFCRYSVDEYWMIPHFEKMLYDNGLLLTLYADAALATNDAVFRRIAIETGEWTMREMQSPDGGYYSALDADTEGEEGKFYVWSPDTVKALLTPEEYAVLAPVYGLDRKPNFETAHAPPCARPSPRSYRRESRLAPACVPVAGHGRGKTRSRRRTCFAAADGCARQAAGRTRAAGAPGARRQGADLLERSDDQGHGARRAVARSSRLRRLGRTGVRFHPHTALEE
jgi:uncharacterized protein YyaL (SSP411 family)